MYDRIQDLPDVLRKGLNADVAGFARGMVNFLIYEENHNEALAVSKTQKALEGAGYTWSEGRWKPLVAKTIATGLISKTHEEKRLVFGWANVVKNAEGKVLLDRQNDFIDDSWELEKAAYDFVLKRGDGGVMHVQRNASRLVESMMFTQEKIEKMGIPKGLLPEGWWTGWKVDDDEAWEGIKKGDFVGFSVHGSGMRKSTTVSDVTHSSEGR
jgi:hypothetical protein